MRSKDTISPGHPRTPRRLGPIFAGLLLLAAMPLTASAQSGLGFLKKGPINYFTDEDTRLMKKNLDGVLSSSEPGAKAQWTNPKTEHSGEAETTEVSTSDDGLPCKKLRIVNNARGMTAESSYKLCNYPGKGWRVPPQAKPKPKS